MKILPKVIYRCKAITIKIQIMPGTVTQAINPSYSEEAEMKRIMVRG
jgi:hypothetical protein